MTEIVAVVVGWILGVGTTGVQRWLDERRRLRQAKEAISMELDEVAHRLLGLVFKFHERRGTLDRQVLTWMLGHIERYDGPYPKEGMSAGVRGLVASSDEQLAVINAHTKGKTPPHLFPRQGAPYAEATVSGLSQLDPVYGMAVLDVLFHLEMLNQRRDDQVEYTKRTFVPGISTQNLEATYGDIDAAEADIHHRAKIVVNKISVLDAAHPRRRRVGSGLLGRK